MARGAMAEPAAGVAGLAASFAVVVFAGVAGLGFSGCGPPRLKPSTTSGCWLVAGDADDAVASTEGGRLVPAQPRQAVTGVSLNTSLPLASLTVSTNQTLTRKPPLANAAYPRAMSIGRNEAAPSDIDRLRGSSFSLKPKWVMKRIA